MDGWLSLIKSDGHSDFSVILDDYFEFDIDLYRRLISLRKKLNIVEDLKRCLKEIIDIEKQFTLFNAKILAKIIKEYNDQIDLVGFHGQTIFHDAEKKISKQLGDGKLLSQITKKLVITDFRQEDLNNDGQGAPLTPIFHKLISEFLNKDKKINFPVNIINIGGITNITQILKNDSSLLNLYAYDIAPGNCLIDEWVRRHSNKKFDDNGDIAKSGKIDDLILNQALDNFNINSFTKSLDIKDFDISFVRGLSFEDGCATLTQFSASLIANGIKKINLLNNLSSSINLICGGGRKNNFLIKSITENFDQKNFEIKNVDDYGINGDFIESQAFGYLAIRSLLQLPNSFPNTTRCKKPTKGGSLIKNF